MNLYLKNHRKKSSWAWPSKSRVFAMANGSSRWLCPRPWAIWRRCYPYTFGFTAWGPSFEARSFAVVGTFAPSFCRCGAMSFFCFYAIKKSLEHWPLSFLWCWVWSEELKLSSLFWLCWSPSWMKRWKRMVFGAFGFLGAFAVGSFYAWGCSAHLAGIWSYSKLFVLEHIIL